MKPVIKKTTIPLYSQAEFGIVIADSILEGCKAIDHWIDTKEIQHDIKGDDGAWSLHGEGRFVIIITRKNLNEDTISHEVFHATVRIMEWIGAKFDIENHEPYAYLNGWLNEFARRKI